MKETIKYLWKEANAKRNGEEIHITWNISVGTSGNEYLWTVKDKVTCYIYIGKNGGYSIPTFSLVTKKYPYGTSEIGYREALQLAQEDLDMKIMKTYEVTQTYWENGTDNYFYNNVEVEAANADEAIQKACLEGLFDEEGYEVDDYTISDVYDVCEVDEDI